MQHGYCHDKHDFEHGEPEWPEFGHRHHGPDQRHHGPEVDQRHSVESSADAQYPEDVGPDEPQYGVVGPYPQHGGSAGQAQRQHGVEHRQQQRLCHCVGHRRAVRGQLRRPGQHGGHPGPALGQGRWEQPVGGQPLGFRGFQHLHGGNPGHVCPARHRWEDLHHHPGQRLEHPEWPARQDQRGGRLQRHSLGGEHGQRRQALSVGAHRQGHGHR